MAMGSSGGTNTAVSEINVTPLIDVLLVLLIIFMVIPPATTNGLNALVPQPPKKTNEPPPDATIVVQVLGTSSGEPQYRINQQAYSRQEIGPKLQQIFAVRASKVMFVKGDPDLYYGSIADVINMGHRAGVESIGILTAKVEAGL